MANIRIGTAELDAAGKQLQTHGQELTDFIATVTNLINNTADDWDSPAANDYRASWETLVATFNDGVEILENMGSNAIETARAHEDIDIAGQQAFTV